MEAAQRIHKHAAARRDPAFANARPANLARDEALKVKRLGPGLFPGFGQPQGGHNGGNSHSGQNPSGDASNPSTGGSLAGTGTGSGNSNGNGNSNSGGGQDNNPADQGAVPRPGGAETSSTRTSSSSSSTSSSTSSTSSSTRTTTTEALTTTKVSISIKPTSVHIDTPTLTSPLPSFSAPTSQAVVIASSTPSPTLNSVAATPTESKSSGPGVGPIIGIVAGSLAGVAVLFILLGFLYKKFNKKEDPYEANPFDKDEFRRHSAMLPDTFDDEVDGTPSMSEHNQFPASMYEHHDPAMAGMAGMGIMAAGAGVAAGAGMSHNESGGPRPPTMFQRHINAVDASASYAQAPPMPSMGAAGYDAYPQLPPLALNGADPYGAAGVAPMANVSNPYAHLDRVHSVGSNGSNGSNTYGSARDYPQQREGGDFVDTAGRPGTAEGRSGTPDLPNMQQTYAAGGVGMMEHDDETRFPQFNSPAVEPLRNPFEGGQAAAPMQQHNASGSFGSANGSLGAFSPPQMASPEHNPHVVQGLQSSLHPQPSLSVRNLMPTNGAPQQQRPVSMVSSAADPDDAYGGVY